MSTRLVEDSSDIVDVDSTPDTNGTEEPSQATGTTSQQHDLILLDEPIETTDIKDKSDAKSKSKKSKAKKLLKRAKSPISGAIHKTHKEFKKLSNLPKHHHTTAKSPDRSPSKEKLTEEYTKLEQSLGTKSSAEWKEYLQMQDRVKQIVLKTQTSLNKYTSHSEDEDTKGKQEVQSTRWTGFDEGSGLEAEVIDTSLKTLVNVPDTCDEVIESDDFNDTSNLIDTEPVVKHKDTTRFIDTVPITPVKLASFSYSMMESSIDKSDETVDQSNTDTNAIDDFLGTSDSVKDIETSECSGNENAGVNVTDDLMSAEDTPAVSESESGVLTGYTFSTSITSDTGITAVAGEIKPTTSHDILAFERPTQSSDTIEPAMQQPEIPSTSSESAVPNVQTPEPANVETIQPEGADIQKPAAVMRGDDDLFALDDDDMDAAPVAPLKDGDSAPPRPPPPVNIPKPIVSMLGEPLQPLVPTAAKKSSSVSSSDSMSSIESKPAPLRATSVPDEFASFDPMKSSSDFMGMTGSASVGSAPVTISVSMASTSIDSQWLGSSPNPATSSFGSAPPVNIETDIFSKIKKMAGSQPVTPARRKINEKPKDHFGFVKQELKPGEEDTGYKSLAELCSKSTAPVQECVHPEPVSQAKTEVAETSTETVAENIDNVDTGTVNNPFMSESFSENANAFMDKSNISLFGIETDTAPPVANSGFDLFMNTDSAVETKPTNVENTTNAADELSDFLAGDFKVEEKECTSTVKVASSSWVDPSAFDTVDIGDAEGTWHEDQTPKDKTQTANAWGGGETLEATKAAPAEDANPFQDDFGKLDDIPTPEPTVSADNPFMAPDSMPGLKISPANPFLGTSNQAKTDEVDLLGDSIQPTLLSDSESFFFDSVADTNTQAVEPASDTFDPFNVTEKVASPNQDTSDKPSTDEDPLDIFSSPSAKPDKKPVKSIDEEGIKVDIKLNVIERPKASALPVAPALAPPPKAPKSPQPPRANPFDRESPPEENFAQFEVKEPTPAPPPEEKPNEHIPKSISTESGTTSEEEDEMALQPLEPFLPECDKDTFKMMLRYPTKKKIAGNRYWKNVIVKLEQQNDGLMIRVLNDARDALQIQELLLQPCYSLSDLTLQQYDQYGKIHTVKLQYVFYKERVGIKTERITPSIVKFKKRSEKPKATMILDHSPQVSELLKFGSLDKEDIIQFMHKVEDAFMNLKAQREKTLTYTKDEITAEVHDEYYAELDKEGVVISQKTRCRVFLLAFLSGMPTVEVGMNDKRRRGKEVVGRADIIPIKTEEWIKLENVEFHQCVDKEEFEKTNNIKFCPLDACKFELLRYRVRLRKNKELPLQLTIQQILKNRKCEIRCDLLVTGYHSYSKKHGQFPCEDIEVRFPIPEVWIYMFRYERRFGYGSIHSSARKPGKIKGLERLTMMAQGNLNQALMEADVGTAKYEHVYRAIVWRIPRLPIRNQGAYTSHLFRLKLDLGPHDEIPKSFESHTNVSFTMPCSTTSQSQIRSIAVTNPNPPEKWVRSLARYEYRIEIEHLDEYPELLAIGTVYKEAARPSLKLEAEEEKDEEEERDPRLAKSDTDSSDSD